MAIDRHPATGHKIGSLLINPGGPGVSGVDFLPDRWCRDAGRPAWPRFDIVGFDPPGVARTAPITCLDSAGLGRYFHVDPGATNGGRVRGPAGGRPHPRRGLRRPGAAPSSRT